MLAHIEHVQAKIFGHASFTGPCSTSSQFLADRNGEEETHENLDGEARGIFSLEIFLVTQVSI